jgi:hypothetical protein
MIDFFFLPKRRKGTIKFDLRLGRGVRLDKVRRLFSDGDDWSAGVPADLVREDGRVDDAEARDAEYAQAWVDDARLGGCADASGRRLEKCP